MPSNHFILCRPLLLLPPIFPSIKVFSSESILCVKCPKYWSFSFSISPSIEYSGLISFRIDWLDLLAVQGTLKSLLQHHSSKASVLWCSAFFMVQLSYPYMTTGKTIALTRWTCREVMGLNAMVFVFWIWVLSQLFLSLLLLSSRGSLVFLCFCHKDCAICISEVIDISPSNLDSSLCFIQPSISHDVLCI